MISMNTFNFSQHEAAKVPEKLFFVLNAAFEGERYLFSNSEEFTSFMFEFYNGESRREKGGLPTVEFVIDKDEGVWRVDYFLMPDNKLDLSIGNNSVFLAGKEVDKEGVQNIINHNVNLFINRYLKGNYNVIINPN